LDLPQEAEEGDTGNGLWGQVKKTSPLFDILRNPVAVTITAAA